MVGLAPMFIYGYGSRPEVRRVAFMGAGITDYSDFLIEPESSAAGMLHILEHLLERRTDWDLCDFQELRSGSSLLNTVMPAGLLQQLRPCSICPVLVLPGSVEELWENLSTPVRTSLRRARNRVTKSGGRFEKAGSSNLDEFLAALFRLHGARWRKRRQPGVLDSQELQTFHREVASRMLERGRLRLYGIRREEKLIAAQYNFFAHGRAYAYLSGFDPAASRASPGKVLLHHSIESAIEEGLTEFDFLRKQESFKYQWGSEDRPNHRVLLSYAAGELSGGANPA